MAASMLRMRRSKLQKVISKHTDQTRKKQKSHAGKHGPGHVERSAVPSSPTVSMGPRV